MTERCAFSMQRKRYTVIKQYDTFNSFQTSENYHSFKEISGKLILLINNYPLICIILDYASGEAKFGVLRWWMYISNSYIPDLLDVKLNDSILPIRTMNPGVTKRWLQNSIGRIYCRRDPVLFRSVDKPPA